MELMTLSERKTLSEKSAEPETDGCRGGHR